jgi:hypothetical protein
MNPEDFQQTYDGGELPRLVGTQKPPAALSAVLAIVGSVLLGLGH